jgi:hypothetical protein
VLRVNERRGLPWLLTKTIRDSAAHDIRFDTAPSVPLIARDSFVAETASKLEQLQASMRLLSRDFGLLGDKVGALKDASDQEHRWYAFQKSEKRSREAKLEEVVRTCRELKGRLDKIESRSGGNFHAYTSFEAVSRKLAELESFRDEAQRTERRVTIRAWIFCGTMTAALAIVLLSNFVAR